MKQTSVASPAFDKKKQPTHRERFLAEMAAAVPWAARGTMAQGNELAEVYTSRNGTLA